MFTPQTVLVKDQYTFSWLNDNTNELQKLVIEQQHDQYSYRVAERIDRPYKYRFPCFAGNTPRQKAYSALKYFGWKEEDIHKALKSSIREILDGEFDFATTAKPENYQKFYVEIPKETPRDKAILVLRGLNWEVTDVAKAVNLSRRMTQYILSTFPIRHY